MHSNKNLVTFVGFALLSAFIVPAATRPARHIGATRKAGVYVSYAYNQKDDIQRDNLAFFWTVGAGGAAKQFTRPKAMFLSVVVAGDECSPCASIQAGLRPLSLGSAMPTLTKALASSHTAVLYRKENSGMDLASHGVGLRWLEWRSMLDQFRYFVFLNSSVRGPFVPAYMPPGWQWTDAFTDMLQRGHALAACSITCLPFVDAGGPGPRAESWAFALDRRGLNVAMRANTFANRDCKLCDDGIVVGGEYGLSKSLLGAGLTMATFMTKYSQDVDWANQAHWNCNNNVHPSRESTYDGVSQHPFELLFVKASWHVAEPFVNAYTRWALTLARGRAGTDGIFDEARYRYAISPEAIQKPSNM